MDTLPSRLQPLAPLSDEDVVRRVVDGDSAAFELLMRRHNQRLFRLARSVVGNDSEAEDVVQDAYVRAYGALPSFRAESTVLTWLTRITLHEALRSRRRRRRAPTTGNEIANSRTSNERSPVDQLADTERRSALVGAFDALPTPHRMVVMLRLIEGRSTREAAAALRITEANVKVRLHRAKQLLAAALQRRGIDELRASFGFAGQRCDRITSMVLTRISSIDSE